MTDAIQTKICHHCKQAKPLLAYHRSKARPDGLREKCKACVTEYQKGRTARLLMRDVVTLPLEKSCAQCQTMKPQAEFRGDKRLPDGLSYYCKTCANERDRQREPKQRRASRIAARRRAELKRPGRLGETKTCKYCGMNKPVTSFEYSPQMADGMKSKCKDCYRPEKLEYWRRNRARRRAEDPIKFRLAQRGNHCSRYGMSKDDFQRMNDAQGGKCAICGGGPNMNRRFLDVDHDHAPDGKVRELLCTKCNTGIGRFNDDPDLCIKAAEYLRKHHQLKLVG